jgi:CubicO group peptidase (beta-lactamase class C family)
MEPEVARTTAQQWQAVAGAPNDLAARAGTLSGAFPDLVTEESGHNARIVRAAELPGSNMVTDARSVARMYAATIGTVDGVRLLSQQTVDDICAVQKPNSRPYGEVPGLEVLDMLGTAPPLGFMRPSRARPLVGSRSFGHGGAGGSFGLADPDAGIGFAYVMNRLSADVPDPRADSLMVATAQCVR